MATYRENVQQAANKAHLWLKAEHDYQFAKSDDVLGDVPTSLQKIMAQEVPDRWERFRVFRKETAYHQASQEILKVCAAARAAIILCEVMNDMPIETASTATLQVLDFQKADLRSRDIERYRERLDLPFDEAIDSLDYSYDNRRRSVMPVFLETFRLAACHLGDVPNDEPVILPEAGHPSGEIVLPAVATRNYANFVSASV